jgi:N-acetylmuramoyl-L-alanine amidase/putative methionine-R-sulfoxide reductase with GAF domain
MATTPTKPDLAVTTPFASEVVPAWPRSQAASAADYPQDPTKPSQLDALQALLAFSSLHDQIRRRKALAAGNNGFDAARVAEFEQGEQFVLDDVLQLVAERAIAITGADGLAIALAENNEIVLRASAGAVRPDVGARIDRDSAFSGACFRTAQIVNCDDTETDPRVNLQACRKLGARSMVAVPLCGRRRVIGLLEAFSSWPFGFNDSDIRNLSLLAELVLGALKPEDEDRFADAAQVAAIKLDPAAAAATVEPPHETRVAPAHSTPVVPAATQKAVEARVKSASTTAILSPTVGEKTPRPERTSRVEKAVPTETSAATAAATAVVSRAAVEEPETSDHRPGLVLLLVGIVIMAAFAGGVLWKLKTAQLSGAMIRTEQSAVKATGAEVTENQPATSSSAAESARPTVDQGPDENSEASAADNSSSTAQEVAKFPRVTGIRHWSSTDTSTVVLDLQDQVQYEAHRLASPERIYFDLRDTQLAPDLVGRSIDAGDTLVTRIRMAQPVAGMTRIVLETKGNSTFSVSLEPNPYRLVVEVRKIGATPKTAVNLFPNSTETEKNKLAIVIPPPTKEDLQLRARVPRMRIVVDAGHGGWDLGTVGRRGLLEKDLVLEIAQRLGKLLEDRLGTEVIYTRQNDNYIPLDERASLANQSQADLFISVHANYSDLPSARGVETYYTSFFSAPGSKEAGSKEVGAKEVGSKEIGAREVDLRASSNGVKNPLTQTLSPTDLHDRIEQSRRLAASVQRSLYGTLSVQNPGLRDRGIKEAGFVVLTGSAMPGILAEVSFVSSPTDEQKLRSDGYREQIAEALYRGIARYAASSKGVKVAAR